jgi:chaperonin cofactor prefoldin
MDKEDLQKAVEQREAEVAAYQVNIDNYSLMIEELPSEWPEDLIEFRGKEINEIAALIDDEECLMQVGDLIFAEKLRFSLRTEKLEQRKSKLVLKVLKDRLE